MYKDDEDRLRSALDRIEVLLEIPVAQVRIQEARDVLKKAQTILKNWEKQFVVLHVGSEDVFDSLEPDMMPAILTTDDMTSIATLLNDALRKDYWQTLAIVATGYLQESGNHD